MFNFLFPQKCVLCRQKSNNKISLCDDCAASLPWVDLDSCCGVCGRILSGLEKGICGTCLSQPVYFDRCFPMLNYKDAGAYFVRQLKFQQRLIYADILANLMIKFLRHCYCDQNLPEVIIAVPLSFRRQFLRGFNQSLQIAKKIGKELDIPIDNKLCRRVRHTQAQSSLSVNERKKNLIGAFRLLRKDHDYKHIAIVDDVITTGATMKALAKLFKKSVKIDLWSCVRAC